MKWTDEDMLAVEEAIERGQIAIPNTTIIETPVEWLNDDPFSPISVPCQLVNWQSTRLGDIELKFIVPYKWATNVADVATAMRKRLVLHLVEWTMDTPTELADDWQ